MLGVGALVVPFGAAVLWNMQQSLSSMLKEEMTRRGLTIAHAVREPAQEYLLTDNTFALFRLLRETQSAYDDVRYIFIADVDDHVTAHTFRGGVPKGIARISHLASGQERGSRLIRTDEGLVRDISVPMMKGRLGHIHVGMKEYAVMNRVGLLMLKWGGAAILIMALGVGVAYWQINRLTRRFSDLVEVTRKVSAGDLDARSQDAVSDELGFLAKAFNMMVGNLKKTQENLIRTGKLAAIGELASGIAHEINNPLNTIGVCTQSLQDRGESTALRACGDFADFPEYLDTINSELFRCKRITENLLDFSRQREPVKYSLDLNRIIRETVSLVEPRARRSRVRLALHLAESIPPVLADSDQIKQVILNLILNAVDHMPKGGELRITTGNKGDGVFCRVKDLGDGIPAKNLKKIFDPFFTTKPAGAGTGLGLAICRKIMEDHHGSIEASSEEGKGAAFVLSFPSATGAGTRSQGAG